jgi:DNA replication protein DnaC
MMNEQTLSKLNAMKLFGMARGFQQRIGSAKAAALSHEEFFGLLVDDEKIYRENAKLHRLLAKARLRQIAVLEDVNYRAARGLDKQVVVELSAGHWLERKQNVLITGPTGVGKSFLACALGNQACRSGYTTNFYRFPRLLDALLSSRGDGTHLKMLTRLSKTSLLILDDFGLSPVAPSEAKDLLEILEDRYQVSSTVITSQLPTRQWHEILGEPTIADAVCDRLLHNAFTIELKGDSMRRRGPQPTK